MLLLKLLLSPTEELLKSSAKLAVVTSIIPVWHIGSFEYEALVQ